MNEKKLTTDASQRRKARSAACARKKGSSVKHSVNSRANARISLRRDPAIEAEVRKSSSTSKSSHHRFGGEDLREDGTVTDTRSERARE